MNLYEQANKDIQNITTNQNEWGVTIILTEPKGQTVTVTGIHCKHHLGVDTDGNLISSKTAHVTISENAILQANPYFPVRDLSSEVDFKNYQVVVKDSTEVLKKYMMQKWMPDETIGLITCVLEDLE